jgi:hypothetical protein
MTVAPTLSQRKCQQAPAPPCGPLLGADPLKGQKLETMQPDSTDQVIIRSKETRKFWGFGR